MKTCRGENSDFDHFLVRGNSRCKIVYTDIGHEINLNPLTPLKINVETLQEPGTIINYLQLGKKSENIETERTAEDTIHTGEERKQIKEVKVEAAEQTVGYQPKQDNRGRFDEECKTAIFGKNTAYKKWIDRPTRSKRLEYESLQKIVHTICKNKKRIRTDKCVKNIEHNIEGNNIKNAYKKLDH